MDADKIAELRRLLAEATPGPWYHSAESMWACVTDSQDGNGHVICTCNGAKPQALARSSLIAAAISALPDLLDAAERAAALEKDCAQMSEEFGLPPGIRPAEGEIARLTRERDEARQLLQDLSCDGCEYGDDCPPFGGTRHGECVACKCRRTLGGVK